MRHLIHVTVPVAVDGVAVRGYGSFDGGSAGDVRADSARGSRVPAETESRS
ncbi:hypothetical protein [Streptomyces sp. NPDC002889]|uniref:hypothetical protein n=1 Tax=Streptomyces sp. NPDC002889 TaxID=3364669 RepID=UPI0036994A7D